MLLKPVNGADVWDLNAYCKEAPFKKALQYKLL